MLAPQSWGAQQCQGLVFTWTEMGESQLAQCWHLDSLDCPQPATARPVPHTGHSDCPGRVMTFPPHLLCSLSPCWFLHPSPSLHLLRFTNPTAVLGEALIQHRAPCQICQKAEMERVTQHWNKPLHDPV